jgi:hypothetical protein
MPRLVTSRSCACVGRRGRTIAGRRHSRWPAPGSDRGRHRRRRRYRAGVLVADEGGVVSAEELLERAWDENADPFTNAERITVSALRKATVTGVGYRIATQPEAGHEGVDRG